MKQFAEAAEKNPALKAEMDALTRAYADDLEREQKKAAMNQKIAAIFQRRFIDRELKSLAVLEGLSAP